MLIGVMKARALKRLLAGAFGRRSAPIILDPHTYRQVHFVIVQTPSGQAMIDHVFVSRFGIFAVKAVACAGWISGQIADPEWTRQHYRTVARFPNPLHELASATASLASVLHVPADRVLPVITFVGDTAFKSEMPPNVTRGVGFAEYIRSVKTPVFGQDEVEALAERLRSDESTADLGRCEEAVSDAAAGQMAKPTHPASSDTSDRCPNCGLPLAAHEQGPTASKTAKVA